VAVPYHGAASTGPGGGRRRGFPHRWDACSRRPWLHREPPQRRDRAARPTLPVRALFLTGGGSGGSARFGPSPLFLFLPVWSPSASLPSAMDRPMLQETLATCLSSSIFAASSPCRHYTP